MKKISAQRARETHQILTLHHRMDNGECRFRLKKSDGTAYIRTEAGDQGRWQESHFHRHVRETYIVQSGWVAYADQNGDELRIKIFRTGELFTTKPGIIHNIYMSANSVIHTVKHGKCDHDDRNTCGTEAFDSQCKRLRIAEEILRHASKTQTAPNFASIYSSEYRHFDNLIWQVPAWATAIFALSIGALGSNNFETVAQLVGVEASSLTVAFSVIVAATLFCFSNVKFRYRMHQRTMKGYSRTPIWKSASSLTQFIINSQAMALFALAALLLDVPMSWVLVVSFLILGGLTWRSEYLLRKS